MVVWKKHQQHDEIGLVCRLLKNQNLGKIIAIWLFH
jgi:hypothetical protein